MISKYFEAAIRQTRERARILKAKIPNPVPTPHIIGLQHICCARIDDIIKMLEYLLTDPDILQPRLVRERIRIYKRAIDDLTQLETIAIPALSRIHPDDHFMNKLLYQVHQEINYPLPPPTVTCLSRDYFCIYTALNLLQVYPAESDFLLHLPDLYHELAHPLLVTQNNPKLEPLQVKLNNLLQSISHHFEKQRVLNQRTTGPRDYFAHLLDTFEASWYNWAHEIFCDLYATYTLGPAYAWAHFHLTATRGGTAHYVPFTQSTHPPDHARMEVILTALQLIGFTKEAKEINECWNQLLQTTGSRATTIYRKACPKELLDLAATLALEGTKKIGSTIATSATQSSVHDVLTTAWTEFRKNLPSYQEWERKAIDNLKTQLSKTP